MFGLRAVQWVLATAVVIAPGATRAQPTTVLTATAPAAATRASSPSRSIGVPDRGRLRRAAELTADEHLHIRESRRTASHGTAELVGMIRRAAARVHGLHPGPKLLVGDLSRERGGHLGPHRSHRSGRDADIGFYLRSPEGEAIEPPHFVQLRRSGCGRLQGQEYCFEPARNWDLVVSLLEDPVARVQYILVAYDIRRRLLAEGERRGASEELMERVSTATAMHGGSASHRSHFHVRIYCPLDDRPECIDEAPFHAWYEGTAAPPTRVVRRMRTTQRRAARRRAARQARRAAASRQARRAAAGRRSRARAQRRAAAASRARSARASRRSNARPRARDASANGRAAPSRRARSRPSRRE